MENQSGFVRLTRAIFTSFSAPENQGIAGITGFGGIFCSWHIATADFSFLLDKYSLILKIVGGFFTVIIAPPLGVFMKDVYEVKVKPSIRFLNKKK